MKSVARAWLLILLAGGLGCSGRPALVSVAGDVRVAGVPLESGEIRFIPFPETPGPTSGSRIRGGRYLAVARGGVLPGRYRVEIESTRGRPEPALPDDDAGPPSPQPIPAAYNTESTLEVVVEKSPRRQTFDFDLERAGP